MTNVDITSKLAANYAAYNAQRQAGKGLTKTYVKLAESQLYDPKILGTNFGPIAAQMFIDFRGSDNPSETMLGQAIGKKAQAYGKALKNATLSDILAAGPFRSTVGLSDLEAKFEADNGSVKLSQYETEMEKLADQEKAMKKKYSQRQDEVAEIKDPQEKQNAMMKLQTEYRNEQKAFLERREQTVLTFAPVVSAIEAREAQSDARAALIGKYADPVVTDEALKAEAEREVPTDFSKI